MTGPRDHPEGPGEGPAELDAVARRAVERAEALLDAAATVRRPWAQRRREALVARLVADPSAKRFAFHLTDRVARCPDPGVAARQLARLVQGDGVPGSLPAFERLGLRAAGWAGPHVPRLVMAVVQGRLRDAGSAVVLDARPARLDRHLRRRQAQGIISNVNVLGEAILGEGEATDRFAALLSHVRRPSVRYLSVKLSAVAANLSVLDFDRTVARLSERLRPLYLEAAAQQPPTFVNLDMEEYRDLGLTLATFQALLGPEAGQPLAGLQAGIVLQAYLPDSFAALVELTGWARRRVEAGGAPIKVRLVKGANLAMELVDAEAHGWTAAPYGSKAEVDANYKRLVEWALRPANAAVVRVGVASHNLYDVCFALELARERQVTGCLDIEMLEGMAEAQVQLLVGDAPRLVLYTPIVAKADLSSAIAYLTRRLEENTAPQNYLAHVHRLVSDVAARREERERFLAAVRDCDLPAVTPRRAQVRPSGTGAPGAAPPAGGVPVTSGPVTGGAVTGGPVTGDSVTGGAVTGGADTGGAVTGGADTGVPSAGAAFGNAPDTDFTLAANRDWLAAARRAFTPASPPSAPPNVEAVDAAVERAVHAGRRWAAQHPAERRRALHAIADIFELQRGRALAAMVEETAKVTAEADTEVSEAVDFARYYAESAVALHELDGLEFVARGVVCVLSPWNFPFAIPAGGLLAALAAGNAVILKPAPQAMAVGALLVELMHSAGVPPDLVQLVATPEDERGRRLITHPGVGSVVLTGSSATAELFTGWRADLRLHAETSGKNAIVVTATADIDQAVRDIVRSAFGNSGQKCSAASLAIVERSVLDRPAFLRQLRDATTSLPVGPADDLGSLVGPLIAPPSGDLARALTTLDDGESWLVEPRPHPSDARCWTPGVKLGVRPGSWFHHTECFGPVLGIMCAASLAEATTWQNDVAYGLTGGLCSLDDDEIAWWLDRVQVGNAYVNRPITGAIVQRQPFGGWKRSVVGPGAKAGGPNYCAMFGSWRETPRTGLPAPPVSRADLRRVLDAAALGAGQARLEAVAADYERWWRTHFGIDHDPAGLASERNRFRYRPLAGPCLLRVDAAAAPERLVMAVLAAVTCRAPFVLSCDVPPPSWLRAGHHGLVEVFVEDQAALARRLVEGAGPRPGRIRVLGAATDAADAADALQRAARQTWTPLLDDPPVHNGRVELARWLREQTVSETRHRYGNPW